MQGRRASSTLSNADREQHPVNAVRAAAEQAVVEHSRERVIAFAAEDISAAPLLRPRKRPEGARQQVLPRPGGALGAVDAERTISS